MDGLEIPRPRGYPLPEPVIPVPTGRIHLEVPVTAAPDSTAAPVTAAPVTAAPVTAAPVTAAPTIIVSSDGIRLVAPITPDTRDPEERIAAWLKEENEYGERVVRELTNKTSVITAPTVAPTVADNGQRKTAQDFANIVDKKIFDKRKQKVSASTTPSTPAAVSAQNSLGETLIFNKLKAFVATDKITPEEATDILTTFTTELFHMVKHEKDVLKNECGKKTCACGPVGDNVVCENSTVTGDDEHDDDENPINFLYCPSIINEGCCEINDTAANVY